MAWPPGGTWSRSRQVEPGGAHPAALVVADNDLVAGNGPADVQPGGHTGDPATGRPPVVRRADLHADREPARARGQRGAQRAERLGQHAGRPAVQQAVRLGVAVHRHRAGNLLRAGRGDGHPHLADQRVLADLGEVSDDLIFADLLRLHLHLQIATPRRHTVPAAAARTGSRHPAAASRPDRLTPARRGPPRGPLPLLRT